MNEMRKAVASQTHKKKNSPGAEFSSSQLQKEKPGNADKREPFLHRPEPPPPPGTERPWRELVVDIEVRKRQEAHKEQSIDTRGERVLKGPLQPAVI